MTKETGNYKKLSLIRIGLALMILGLSVYVVSSNWQQKVEQIKYVPDNDPWFAPYVDVTAKPTYSFEQINQYSKNAVLSFIVSSSTSPCEPTWGTFYDLDTAAKELDLDRRIARLRQQGGEIAISFGGAINDELALKCTDEEQLLTAYKNVIDRYQIDTIDLDLEGESLHDYDAANRRARVFAKLQNQRKSENKNLAIWLTLPVSPQGLTKEGTDAVETILQNAVDLAGINVMIMNYAGSKEQGQTMLEASTRALIETHRQLDILYKQKNLSLHTKTLWRKIGTTPMIGQNDIYEEVFTVEDAKAINQFALENGLGRISMWSINRDIQCGENYVDTKTVSDSCSGIIAEKHAFTKTLSTGFEGGISRNSGYIAVANNEQTKPVVDNPEESPYQIWQPVGAYPKGVKVVWRGNVYEAKWWTKNDMPDNPVLQYWETPWKLMGPVLPGEKPIKQPTLPVGTYSKWNGVTIYEGGNRVLFDGVPFQAKWWNQGDSPAVAAFNPDNSPWIPLTQEQIKDILKNNDKD